MQNSLKVVKVSKHIFIISKVILFNKILLNTIFSHGFNFKALKYLKMK